VIRCPMAPLLSVPGSDRISKGREALMRLTNDPAMRLYQVGTRKRERGRG